MKYALTIDQSTSGTKAALLDARGVITRRATLPHKQFYPAPGWAEHDAEEIFRNVVAVLQTVLEGVPPEDVACLGIANQRETTVLWEKATGRPVCPAVVWQDVRGAALLPEWADSADSVRERTGLQLSAYYSAAKAAAVLREDPALRARCARGEIRMGTVDSYLLWRLTGGKTDATDVSNASRTQLLDLRRLAWDDELIRLFGLYPSMLPERVALSDARFGVTACEGLPRGIPITAALGDSHASFFAHGCHSAGQVKTSYGTGSSLMLNVGERPAVSRNGLSASVGFGWRGRVSYVLEGNITCSADTLCWLRDELGLIADVAEAEALAASVPDAQGVCLIPAFSGLGAPYFDEGARALLYGMNRGTTRAHVVRAALESIAQQNADVLDAMARDMGAPITELCADGGASVNRLLMQTQADLVPCQVRCAAEKDLTALGAGLMAGLSAGLYDEFRAGEPAAVYAPKMAESQRLRLRGAWADAVRRAR